MTNKGKQLVRMICSSFGIYIMMLFVIFLCKAQTVPWYIHLILISASAFCGLDLEKEDKR